jgi:hypothetical protein
MEMAQMIKTMQEYVSPPPKTLTEKCVEYVKENPTATAKGVATGVVGWYIIPIAVGIVGWLPCIGAGYYLWRSKKL